MTWVNANIPTSSDIRAAKYQNDIEKERDFWLKKAEELQRELENIFDHAKAHGRIELHHRGEKLVLYVTDPALTRPVRGIATPSAPDASTPVQRPRE